MAEVMEWVKSLSNDELVHHLMNDYGYKCGPITVSTRSVYEKKLQSFKNNTTISGKAIPASQTKTNGTSDHHEEDEAESQDAGKYFDTRFLCSCHKHSHFFQSRNCIFLQIGPVLAKVEKASLYLPLQRDRNHQVIQ